MDYSFGHAGFIVFWMLNWVGMLSVYVLPPALKPHLPDTFNSGMALEAMITLLTVRFVPFFMILWIISMFQPSALNKPLMIP